MLSSFCVYEGPLAGSFFCIFFVVVVVLIFESSVKLFPLFLTTRRKVINSDFEKKVITRAALHIASVVED